MWLMCSGLRNLIFPGQYKLCNNQLQPKALQNVNCRYYYYHIFCFYHPNKRINIRLRTQVLFCDVSDFPISSRLTIVEDHTVISCPFHFCIFIVAGHSLLMLPWRLHLLKGTFFVVQCVIMFKNPKFDCLFVSDFRFSDSTFTFTYSKGPKR